MHGNGEKILTAEAAALTVPSSTVVEIKENQYVSTVFLLRGSRKVSACGIRMSRCRTSLLHVRALAWWSQMWH